VFGHTAPVISAEQPPVAKDETVLPEPNVAGKKIVDRMKRFWDNL